MGTYVNEETACAAQANGTKIGSMEPCRESKWGGWDVYAYDGEIVACGVTASGDVICGEKISADELGLYVDDVEHSKAALSMVALAQGEKK
jgi:hypothetical protein